MCEITIFDPEEVSTETIAETAMELFRTQRSGLGIVAVYDEGGEFAYNIYRSVDAEAEDVMEFVGVNENCERFIVHGRMATSGERDNSGTHPIPVDCPHCDVDHILHNGVLRRWRSQQAELREAGHEFTTDVDTEVMAHELGDVPESIEAGEELIEENELFQGQAAVILLNSERIFIAVNIDSHYGSYRLNQNCEMYKSRREFGNHERTETLYDMVVISPQEPAEPQPNDAEGEVAA